MADILHRITIHAPPERVFEAITTQEGLKSWWTPDVIAQPRLGTIAEFGFHDHAVVFRMRIDEFRPQKRIHWTCVDGPPEWKGTFVTFDLTPAEAGKTKLQFKHCEWRSVDGEFAGCNTTWGHLLVLLKEYAEGGSPALYFA